MWLGPRAYRCERCGETSPEVYSRRELDELRYAHRMEAHGGFIPDGEVVLQPERVSLAELSREQRIVGAVILAVILVSLVFKVT
ncbi:hypothetical protein ACFC09_15400 [Streptomyces sp. NPDC056161]|uniref:hypothetical protein n=1 Tax=Streptomyces sp. NPDC056161 TaxID=3345732 RepID=UPI0035E3465D